MCCFLRVYPFNNIVFLCTCCHVCPSVLPSFLPSRAHARTQRLATSGLDVYAHNIETVRRLQPFVRDKRAGYDQSLSVLERAKVAGAKGGVYTKTSLMLGLGETEEEILEVNACCVFGVACFFLVFSFLFRRRG